MVSVISKLQGWKIFNPAGWPTLKKFLRDTPNRREIPLLFASQTGPDNSIELAAESSNISKRSKKRQSSPTGSDSRLVVAVVSRCPSYRCRLHSRRRLAMVGVVAMVVTGRCRKSVVSCGLGW